MPIFLAIANLFGISVFRLIAYAAIAATVTAGALTVRHHYIAKGYASAIAAVKKQDDRAVSAAAKVEQKAASCQDGTNGYWDVLTQACKLDDAP
jgi:hypothetical protein